MTATVEQTQNDLGRLLKLASGGEEIVITQGGTPVAKLTGIPKSKTPPDRVEWLTRRREMREATATGKPGRTSDEILEEDRADRF